MTYEVFLVYLFYPCKQPHYKKRDYFLRWKSHMFWSLHTWHLCLNWYDFISMWQIHNVPAERRDLMDGALGGESGAVSSISGPSLDLCELLQDFVSTFLYLQNNMKKLCCLLKAPCYLEMKKMCLWHVSMTEYSKRNKRRKAEYIQSIRTRLEVNTAILAGSPRFVHLEIWAALLHLWHPPARVLEPGDTDVLGQRSVLSSGMWGRAGGGPFCRVDTAKSI